MRAALPSEPSVLGQFGCALLVPREMLKAARPDEPPDTLLISSLERAWIIAAVPFARNCMRTSGLRGR